MAARSANTPDSAPRSSPARLALLVVGGAAIYSLTFYIGFALPAYAKGFSAVWVAGGVGLAVLLRLPRSLWPWQVAAFFVAGNLANVLTGRPLGASLGFMAANMAETVGSALLMQRCCGHTITLERVREVLSLLLCAWAVNGLTAMIGAGTAAVALGAPFWPFWKTWAAADGVGLLLVTPLALSVTARRDAASAPAPTHRLETAVFAAVWLLVCYSTVGLGAGRYFHTYAAIGLLAYPAIRLGMRATVVAVVILGAMTLGGPAVQHGPLLWGGQTLAERATEAQIFLAFAAMTGMLMAASQTERAAAQSERGVAEDRYRTVVEHTADLITRVDAQGTILFANSATAELWGLPAAACIGRSALEFVHPEDRQRTIEQFGAWLASGQRNASFENRQGSAEHGWRDTLWTSSLVTDPAGGSFEAIGIARDITQRKSAETQALQAAKLDAVSRLAGGVAHSYNNALQAILGHVDLALEALPAESTLREDLQSVRSLATRTAAITSQLLAFSAHRAVAPREIDLNALVTGILPTLRELLGTAGTLQWQPTANLPRVRIDQTQMEQALVVLVTNCRDALGSGGQVTLATGPSRCARDGGHTPEGHVQISVTDTGRGFAPEALAHLFEPFYTTKPAGQGTGLGLSAVRELMRAMGGHVEVTSSVGAGTTVTLCLPGALSQQPRRAAKSNQREPSRQTTVLLVDDDDAVRRVTHRSLVRHGYRVIEATTAEEALELVEQTGQDVDIVLTDIVMPGLGGHWLRERMAEARPSARCLLMSGYAQNAAPEGVAFLAKPFSTDALVRQLEALLSGVA